jgi:hypothetical protein
LYCKASLPVSPRLSRASFYLVLHFSVSRTFNLLNKLHLTYLLWLVSIIYLLLLEFKAHKGRVLLHFLPVMYPKLLEQCQVHW